jgi:hypothetical protein
MISFQYWSPREWLIGGSKTYGAIVYKKKSRTLFMETLTIGQMHARECDSQELPLNGGFRHLPRVSNNKEDKHTFRLLIHNAMWLQALL